MSYILSEASAASRDADLLDRLTTAAAEAGVSAPQQWTEGHARELVTQPITDAGDTIASVHAYAVETYQPTPRPGQNPAAVTDAYLRAAVAKLKPTV